MFSVWQLKYSSIIKHHLCVFFYNRPGQNVYNYVIAVYKKNKLTILQLNYFLYQLFIVFNFIKKLVFLNSKFFFCDIFSRGNKSYLYMFRQKIFSLDMFFSVAGN